MTVVQEPRYTAAKAYVGGAIAALVAGLGVIFTGLDDGIISQQEWVGAAIATLVALGGVFGGVYATANKLKG
jgi:hypothetical protein